VPQGAAPQLGRQSFTVTADLDLGQDDDTGVILATGSSFGGWAFYLKDGRPTVLQAFSHLPRHKFAVTSDERLGPGKARVAFVFASEKGRNAGGQMTICVNGRPAGGGRIEHAILGTVGIGETLDIGRDTGVPVSRDYDAGKPAGSISRVAVKLGDVAGPCG
jgi:arylsulfatase